MRDARCAGKALAARLTIAGTPNRRLTPIAARGDISSVRVSVHAQNFQPFIMIGRGKAQSSATIVALPHPVFGRNSLAPVQLSSYGHGRAARRGRW